MKAHRRTLLALAAAALAWSSLALGPTATALAAPGDATDTTALLASGRLISQDGTSVAGVKLTWDNVDCTTHQDIAGTADDWGITTTGSDGRFSFTPQTAGCYLLWEDSIATVLSLNGSFNDVILTGGATNVTILIAHVLASDITVTGQPSVNAGLGSKVEWFFPVGATLSYQWYRGSTPIAGATRGNYNPTVADVGAMLTLRLTVASGGYSATIASPPVGPVAAGTAAIGAVEILGTADRGATLGSRVTQISPPGYTLAYQWLRNASPIPGATAGTYTVGWEDLCASLSLRVTASASGYNSATKESPLVPGPDFTDVPASHTFHNAICWAAQTGITRGTGASQTSYAPANPVNRGSMAQFLYRLAGSPTWRGPAVSPFADVKTSDTFYQAITWLYDQGVTVGVTIGGKLYYQPDNAVNRGSMAAFLKRLAGNPAWRAPTVSPFTDLPTSHTFYAPITWLANAKIAYGSAVNGQMVYQPANPVNRGSMAAFLQRLANTGLHCGNYPAGIGC